MDSSSCRCIRHVRNCKNDFVQPSPSARATSLKLTRRRFLSTAGAALAGAGAVYTYGRGVRYPALHFVGAGPPTRSDTGGAEVSARGAVFQDVRQNEHRFRAFAPEPVFTVRGAADGELRVVVENVHPGAELIVDHAGAARPVVVEDRSGLTRSVTVKRAAEATRFLWRFPGSEQYRFAAIGDTGGGAELQWVLERAAGLGADFLVHLGDFYYEEGDYERAAGNLNAAAIPTYAAIGNHDFSKGQRVLAPTFHRLIGPSNSLFTLGGIEFVNFDTAAAFVPSARGRRARILDSLQPVGSSPAARDRVAFTHAPLADPDPERGHAVGRAAEARWLRDALLAGGTRSLLAGHIHIKDELDDQGLYTYISGQGLAHADLIGDGPYRRYAEILLGDVEPGEPVRYQWQPLNMPFEAHCNARNLGVLDAMQRPDVKARLLAQCGKA